MKKLAIIMLMVTPLVWAEGYATKGTVEFGGNLGYSSDKRAIESQGVKTYDYKTTEMTLAPEFSYFVMDNISIGGIIERTGKITRCTPVGGTADETKVTSTGLFFAPRYVLKYQSGSPYEMYPYAGLLLGIISDKTEYTPAADTDKTSITAYGIQGGVKVKITGGGLLNLGLRYLMGSGENKHTPLGGTETKTDIKSFSDLSLNAGFTLFLP